MIAEEGFLISPCYSLELCIQMDISSLFSFATPWTVACHPLSSYPLEWVALPLSTGSSQLRDQTWVLPHCRWVLYHLSHQGSPSLFGKDKQIRLLFSGKAASLNAEFQRIPRRDKKAFLSDQCKEIEENNRMGKTRDLFKKNRDLKGTFYAKMGTIKTEMVGT